MFIETFYRQSEMDEKNEFGSFLIADSQKSEIVLKNNLQGNDDLSCSPSRSSKSLTCLRVPWLLKSACTSNGDLCFSFGRLDAVPRNKQKYNSVWERSGSILECLTRDQFKRLRVRASSASLYCVLEQDTSILA